MKEGLRVSTKEVEFPGSTGITQTPREVRKLIIDGMQAAHEHI